MTNQLWVFTFLLISLALAGDPVPPTSWPPVFWSWMMTTVVEENVTKPISIRGQFVVYDSVNQYSCRYLEQKDLVNKTNKIRGNDFCDYAKGMHYSIEDTTVKDPACSSTTPLNTNTLPPLVWPAEFLQKAVYLGTDYVNQRWCDHFYAIPVTVNGQDLQIDLWSTNDTLQYPCQISVFEVGAPFHVTWAFDAFNTTIPTDARKCTLSRLQCAEKGYRCEARRGLDQDKYGMGLRYACDPHLLDCDSLNPGGEHFEPNTVVDHADWAFNSYFQKYKYQQGELACDFGGVAQMVPPSDQDSFEVRLFGSAPPPDNPINWLASDLVCP